VTDIQQRIAAAIQRQAELNMDCDRDMDDDPHDHWLDLADAVVSELGLTREHGVSCVQGVSGRNVNPVPLPDDYGPLWTRYSRYVTEWVSEAPADQLEEA
jgi:hypothetical protein